MQEGEDYYFTDNGLLVFTSSYLLRRGCCCGNGCKHCPYDYSGVAEPQRTYLIEKRLHEKKNDK